MVSPSLLEPHPLQWNQKFPVHLVPSPSPSTSGRYHLYRPFILTRNFRIQGSSPVKFGVRCFFSEKGKSSTISNSKSSSRSVEFVNGDKPKRPMEVIANSIVNALKALRKPAIAAVLLGLLLMYDPNSALAASGGRVGGSAFSSRSSSSSRSYSTPRMGSEFSYSVPYSSPSVFGGGIYVGPAVGVGVGAGSSFFFILAGFAAFLLVSGFLSDRSDSSVLTASEKTSVLKLQV